ncbi:hypothetical protein EC968_007187 [Mortierella alpina]|nr:hypothetical protein EC968_007187 [Mortierella alpina]
MTGTFIRKDIRKLTDPEMDNLIRAFDAIQKLPPDDPNSYFMVVHRMEQALQSRLPGVPLALPYWDETDSTSLKHGIPKIFLQKTYTFSDNSGTIPNPLYSYKFQANVIDRAIQDVNYSKYINYETVRYPFSGLVGPDDIDQTNAHNDQMHENGEDWTNGKLNGNIINWLNSPTFINSRGKTVEAGTHEKYKKCLAASNYTVFSNRTSATHWNDERLGDPHFPHFQSVVSLEITHDSIHLAIGGFDIPSSPSDDQIADANGDMGENDTAGFDPIFYFHHCFVDLMFWRCQVKHKKTEALDLIQGPLDPFKNSRDPKKALPSHDVTNIANLGYTYEYSEQPHEDLPNTQPAPILTVSNISRTSFSDSFVISAWARQKNDANKKILIGTEAILSRNQVAGCLNCQNHLEVRAHFPLEGWTKEEAENTHFDTYLHTRPQNRGTSDGNGSQRAVHKPRTKLWTDCL